MLNKRTQILFDNNCWFELRALARAQNTSVGELVRKAVNKVYLEDRSSRKAAKQAAFEKILELRKKIKPITSKEIKEFINYGRKY